MTGSLTVARRFCGPPGSGNGGYVCGLIAGFLDGPAEVTLRLPPPLGSLWDAVPDDTQYLLGRFAARQLGAIKAGDPHVVVGWRLAAQGRKILAGSALFTASGQAVGVAQATWIRLLRSPFLPANTQIAGTAIA